MAEQEQNVVEPLQPENDPVTTLLIGVSTLLTSIMHKLFNVASSPLVIIVFFLFVVAGVASHIDSKRTDQYQKELAEHFVLMQQHQHHRQHQQSCTNNYQKSTKYISVILNSSIKSLITGYRAYEDDQSVYQWISPEHIEILNSVIDNYNFEYYGQILIFSIAGWFLLWGVGFILCIIVGLCIYDKCIRKH